MKFKIIVKITYTFTIDEVSDYCQKIQLLIEPFTLGARMQKLQSHKWSLKMNK